ncbi:MAG: RluA family pseudouridine synthase [Deltaproteobacteria bacterium]|nr:RluA family pseudouridine synthase [Deltaproteobacteria bacterium]MBN2672710.1 RluA family pseudouridine synthase [Deltaproteobacteria bacterium]
MTFSEHRQTVTESWVVSAEEHGQRLDHFLRDKEIEPSRSQLKKYVEDGQVTVDGMVVNRPSKKLKFKQLVVLDIPPLTPLNAEPEPMELDIQFEDDAVVVINKPQGMVVHPAPGHPSGTLVNGLVHRFSITAGDALRPGLVHRLDKDTSGLMVVAKTETALKRLTEQFQVHSVDRRYRVLVTGNPPDHMEIRSLHGRKANDRKLFSSKVTRGKEAISVVETVERFRGAALIRVTLHTGRTHQVRVHCFDNGFPLLGDPLYSPRRMDSELMKAHKNLPGQALHAELLGFDHPETGERMRFEIEPPPTFLETLSYLRKISENT